MQYDNCPLHSYLVSHHQQTGNSEQYQQTQGRSDRGYIGRPIYTPNSRSPSYSLLLLAKTVTHPAIAEHLVLLNKS